VVKRGLARQAAATLATAAAALAAGRCLVLLLHDAAGEGYKAIRLDGPHKHIWLLLLLLLLLWLVCRAAGVCGQLRATVVLLLFLLHVEASSYKR
jgi:hypothetical protein